VNVLRFAVLGEIAPLLAMTAVSVLFFLAALFIWRSRLSPLWLIIAVGTFIAYSCSNVPGYMANPVFLIMMVVATLCLFGAVFFQFFKEKQKPKKFAWISLTTLVLFAAFLGTFYGINVAEARDNQAPAQDEIWAVPAKYDSETCPQAGSVEKLTYTTKAYATDSRSVEKSAYVYLPYGYDENIEYNILYLLHGSDELEDYWLVANENNKTMVDNLIYYGDIEPLIIVTPTWYTEDDYITDSDKLTFGYEQELRNDLLPAVESEYSTYAVDTTPQGFTDSREHRAIAGLSRGSVITFRAGLCESLDYFSWFGNFSGCLVEEDEFENALGGNDYKINYLYNTSGSFDFLLKEHVLSVRYLLETEPRLVEGENCEFDIFPVNYHSAASWHLALYNCLQKFFT
jgi:enterochelin esterase-like enzyme